MSIQRTQKWIFFILRDREQDDTGKRMLTQKKTEDTEDTEGGVFYK